MAVTILLTQAQQVSKFNAQIAAMASTDALAPLRELRAELRQNLIYVIIARSVLGRGVSIQLALQASRNTVKLYDGNVPGLPPAFVKAVPTWWELFTK